MKFRGRMTDLLSIRKFYSVLGTMAKLSKRCVLRLTADKLFFILTENGSNGGGATSASGAPTVWCELDRSHFFSEYNMEGVTAREPEIYLELEPDRLARTLNALKAGAGATSARSLKVKLTRKHDVPCLSFEIELAPSATAALASFVHGNDTTAAAGGANPASSRTCTHDVPVNLIPRRLWQDFAEPEMQVKAANPLSNLTLIFSFSTCRLST